MKHAVQAETLDAPIEFVCDEERTHVYAADYVSDNDMRRVEELFDTAVEPAFFTIRAIRMTTAIDANHITQAVEDGGFARKTMLGKPRRPVFAPINQQPTRHEKHVAVKHRLRNNIF